MKRFQLVIVTLLIGCVAGLAYRAVKIETEVARWRLNVKSAEALAAINERVLDAHIFSRDITEACRMLANENGILCEREVKMTKYVTAVEDENTRLKGALKEAVVKLEDQRDEINQLHNELEKAYSRMDVLERALGIRPHEADDVKNELLDIFDTVVNLIPILL